MKYYLPLLFLITLTACFEKSIKPKSVEKENKSVFNLEKITFNEKVFDILKDNIDSTANEQRDYVEKGFSEAFDYPEGYKFEPWNGEKSFYGKAFYSKQTDSIAHYKDLYFNRIAFLLHNNKIVAVLANATVLNEADYDKFTGMLNEQFGEPTFNPQTDQDVFYQWTTTDRYLQTDYFKGASVSVTTNEPMKVEEVFTIQFLIFDKKAADEINATQQANYLKTKEFKILPGDFEIYSQNPNKNLEMMNDLLEEKFK